MNEDEIFDIIQPIVAQVTGLPLKQVILADPNEHAPDGEYAAIRPLQNIIERGQANIIRSTSASPNAVDIDVRAQIMAECSINFYRGNAMSSAQQLKQANKIPTVSNTLLRAKLGWSRTGPVNNLTTLQGSRQEPRAQISIFLLYSTSNVTTINSIENVPYEIQQADGQVLESGAVLTPDAP